MPRFHFNLTGRQTIVDEVGEDLEDAVSARLATIEIMAETISDRAEELLAGDRYMVEAFDGAGRLVYRLSVDGDTG